MRLELNKPRRLASHLAGCPGTSEVESKQNLAGRPETCEVNKNQKRSYRNDAPLCFNLTKKFQSSVNLVR